MPITTQDALRRYLYLDGPAAEFSAFRAALRDAREATRRDLSNGQRLPGPVSQHAMWLGAVGYLLLLDQIGTTVQPATGPCGGDNAILEALACFAPHLTSDEANALYALRCALAHDYALANVKRGRPDRTHHFVLSPVGDLIELPAIPWDGDWATMTGSNATRVNVVELGNEVERVVSRVLALFLAGQLDTPLAADELNTRYILATWPT